MVGNLEANVERQVQFEFYDEAEICTNDKAFSFLVKIGEVTIDDNFVGFEIAFRYDETKIRLYPQLFVANTISGNLNYDPNFFNLVQFEIEGTDSILCRGEAMQVGAPVPGPPGNEYLVGFAGEYIGEDECGPFDYISFDYIDFLKYLDLVPFPGQDIVFVPHNAELATGDISSNQMYLQTDVENFVLDSAKYFSTAVTLSKNGKMQNVAFDIETTNSNLFDLKIISTNDANIEIIDSNSVIEDGVNKIELIARILSDVDDINCFNLEYELKNNETDSCFFNLAARDLDNCKCINDYQSDEYKIINKIVEDTTNVNESIENLIKYGKNEIIVSSETTLSRAYLYNLKGELIEVLQPIDNKINIVKANYLSGLYFLTLEDTNHSFENRKIFLNN